ncbi:MAG: type II secretion system F family protein [Succiniclasticum sp.]|uniref:type II secretion system F family protein n=1 Tax=Succiniclasticum sp. TaxID=2775030 RepID=UPI002A91C6F1|nr:type II secretion system F family protein [Succiniclasticum sp.]MDY6290806.1 type II secretion system F family protein [Succiniclasticum sp.]
MRTLVFLISLLVTFLVFFVLYYVVKTKIAPGNQVHQRIKDLGGGGNGVVRTHAEELARIPFLDRTVLPLIHSAEQFLTKFAPSEIHATVDKKLMLAGKQGQWSVNRVITVWLLCQALFLALGIHFSSSQRSSYFEGIVFVWIFVIIGAFLPFAYLNSLIRKRQDFIIKQLPEVLDLLSISVQAGLSFDGALRKITNRMTGPVIDEFKRMQQDVRMGAPRARALQAVAKRCDVEDMHLFITSVVQAERLGTSMGKTLINQADNMRERRRQRAKAAALKAPIKMLFPLVLFIFPAMFVVILVPHIFNIVQKMGILK